MITEVNAKNMTPDELERYAYIGDPMAKQMLQEIEDAVGLLSPAAAAILAVEEELDDARDSRDHAQREVDNWEDEIFFLEEKLDDLKKKRYVQ